MECDDRDPRAGLKTRGQNAQTLLERAELIVYFHPQRLKRLCRRMSASVAADDFFDRARQL